MDTKNSIWNTKKSSTESKGAWDNMVSEPVQEETSSYTSVLNVQHVYKQLPIFSTILADHVEFNKYLKEVILEHRQNNPETIKSNVKAWHSSWQTHEENLKFQPLVERICNACTFISQGYFQCQTVEFVPFNLWAMMYEEGEHTIRHSHFPSDFSAVYYVDVEPGCAPVLFETPQEDGVNDKNETLTIQPENGLLVVWPSLIHHEVPPTKGRRMCISMNLDKKHVIKGMDGLPLNAPGIPQ